MAVRKGIEDKLKKQLNNRLEKKLKEKKIESFHASGIDLQSITGLCQVIAAIEKLDEH